MLLGDFMKYIYKKAKSDFELKVIDNLNSLLEIIREEYLKKETFDTDITLLSSLTGRRKMLLFYGSTLDNKEPFNISILDENNNTYEIFGDLYIIRIEYKIINDEMKTCMRNTTEKDLEAIKKMVKRYDN